MDKDAYIKQLETENAELKKRIEELERLLGINSKNSSKPPSSDPLGMSVTLPKRRRKKRGARKGHQPHLRELLSQEFVNKHFHLKPEMCTCGSTNLEETSEEPLRHQVVDIPPIKPEVTEYVQHISRCKDCGELVYRPLPDDIRRRHFGAGVLAMVAILTGRLNTSKRKALAMMNEVFSIPMSLGGLSNCEGQVTDILEQPYNEAAEHVREQDIGHADETGWPRGNKKKGWLWTFCCVTAAVFMVHANRSQKAARKLMGDFKGKLVTDRYGAYNFYQLIRQICWAHLKRDFKAVSESKGELGKIGYELYGLAKDILKLRKRVRDGTLQWETFQRRMPELQKRVESLLKDGASFDGKLGGKCRKILKHKKYLWTFVQDQRVEPTNNFAERIVRQGVLWRKSSFGTQSQRGARYVERVLTVCATCRLQGRSVIKYLRNVCHCHLNGLPVPLLIKPAEDLTKSA
ncbi:MAG: IS66 family transposase [Planctomycetes bacterium]|nr:IS66 family transposase [Planctomycetota bacterium]